MRIASLAGTLLSLAIHVSADTEPGPSSTGGIYPPNLKPLISRANTLLSLGQFHEAAATYSEAIEQDPTAYTLYYKRGTAYFSLSRHSSALEDFAQVIKLTKDSFPHAHFMTAKIYTREGRYSMAKSELDSYPRTEDAVTELRTDIADAEAASAKAELAMKSGLWTTCYESATEALRTSGYSPSIRQLRAECAVGAGDFDIAIGDLSRLSHLVSPTERSLMRIFRIAYFLAPAPPSGPGQNPALTALKQCLNSDPDSKACLPAHRLLKKFNKQFDKLDKLQTANNWVGINALLIGPSTNFLQVFLDALELHTSERALLVDESTPKSLPLPSPLKTSPRLATLYRAACKAHTQTGKSRSGRQYCDKLREMKGEEDDETAVLGIADALLKNEEYQDAVRLLEDAFAKTDRQSQPIQEVLIKAKKLLKQSNAKDYYKILGAPRDGDAATIKKAYRKAAKTAHPDKGGSEKQMADVNEAYEVLSKPELRARFDAGDDPMDNSQQQGWAQEGGFPGGHPFAQFFQQGAGGAQFSFNFGH